MLRFLNHVWRPSTLCVPTFFIVTVSGLSPFIYREVFAPVVLYQFDTVQTKYTTVISLTTFGSSIFIVLPFFAQDLTALITYTFASLSIEQRRR